MSPLRTLLEALRRGEVVARTRLKDVDAGKWEAVVELAISHGVGPQLQRVLAGAGVLGSLSFALQERLTDARRATAGRNLRIYAEFNRIARAMAGRQIPLMALKGLPLAELVYGDISLRPMGDLDLLVPKSRAVEAIAALQSLGYGKSANLSGAIEARLEAACALGFTHREHGVYAEIHWALSETGDRFVAPIEEIWRTAVPATLGGAPTLIMSPEFLLLHVCAHLACKHLFIFELRALTDVAELAGAQPGLDWALFVAQAQQHGWRRGVAIALRLAREHLGAQVPDDVLSTIGGDAIDAKILSDAIEQIMAAPQLPPEVVCSPNFLGLAGVDAGGKLAAVFGRVFAPRSELALTYGVARDSPLLPLYYFVRVRDLLRRYAGSFRALRQPGSELALAAARRTRLAQWIGGASP